MKARLVLTMLCTLGAQASFAAQSPAEITIRNFKFAPETLKVPVGTTVKWTNKDEDVHTVMSRTGLFVSSAMDTGDSFEYTFTKPGTYLIGCSLHPQMAETIVVEN